MDGRHRQPRHLARWFARGGRLVSTGNRGGHILSDQLQVDEATFWACVQDKVAPDRGMPTPPPEALPADLVHLLISRVGVDEAEVATMTKEEAVARLQKYWVDGV